MIKMKTISEEDNLSEAAQLILDEQVNRDFFSVKH